MSVRQLSIIIVLPALIAAALAASPSASAKRARGYDPCPSAKAVLAGGGGSLDEALTALHRRAPLVWETVGMDGHVYPITAANTFISMAVILTPASTGMLAQWYKAAVRRCGKTVALQTWAFRTSLGHAQNVMTGANIALLAKTPGGWRFYGAIGDSARGPWR